MVVYPKISIVTPSFNQAQYIEDTILSVISQNYPNLEYIIIDGGSTDGSVEIIKKYERYLTYWVSEPDLGMYYAIQKGFDRSTGEIMAWINSDDMYHKNALYTVADIFDSFPQINWLVGATTSFDESGRTVIATPTRMFSKFDFYNHDFKWLQQESVFWRRILWNNTGSSLNLSLKYAGDFALWMKYFSCDQLFVTQALIGGFRWRSQDQISLEHIDEYLSEVESVYSSNSLSDKDKMILDNFNRLRRIEKIIKKFKIFRTDWLIKRYKNKFFNQTRRVDYDRQRLEFIISD
jgi:glycosyltransferase involved in cell wall biosynthesis